MRTSVVVASVGLAIASYANAKECSAVSLSFAMLPLAPKAAKCAFDSDFDLTSFTGMPNVKQLRAMCKSDACHALLKQAKTADMPDCELTINGTAYNIKESVDLMSAGCDVSNIVDDVGTTLFGP